MFLFGGLRGLFIAAAHSNKNRQIWNVLRATAQSDCSPLKLNPIDMLTEISALCCNLLFCCYCHHSRAGVKQHFYYTVLWGSWRAWKNRFSTVLFVYREKAISRSSFVSNRLFSHTNPVTKKAFSLNSADHHQAADLRVT